MSHVFGTLSKSWKSLDYVCGWFMKFANYANNTLASCAFVSSNSVVQGEQVARLWPLIFARGQRIFFAHESFRWANLASHNAGVTVVIIGLSRMDSVAKIYFLENGTESRCRGVGYIGPYLVPNNATIVHAKTHQLSDVGSLVNGSKPVDGGHLLLSCDEARRMRSSCEDVGKLIRKYIGSDDAINGKNRFCLWIRDEEKEVATEIPEIADRLSRVAAFRRDSPKPMTQKGAATAHAFQQIRQLGNELLIVVPSVSSETRQFIPVAVEPKGTVISNLAYAFLNEALWNLSLVASTLHLVWITTVCGKLETRIRYSSTLGWNTFPVPILTDENRVDLTRCAEENLLALE
jgi:hypothetical protein